MVNASCLLRMERPRFQDYKAVAQLEMLFTVGEYLNPCQADQERTQAELTRIILPGYDPAQVIDLLDRQEVVLDQWHARWLAWARE
jgi:hypothetical protein